MDCRLVVEIGDEFSLIDSNSNIKKFISFSLEHSCVNCELGWKLFSCSRDLPSTLSLAVQMNFTSPSKGSCYLISCNCWRKWGGSQRSNFLLWKRTKSTLFFWESYSIYKKWWRKLTQITITVFSLLKWTLDVIRDVLIDM